MVRNMDDDSAWCPTCHNNFDSIQSVCYHHNTTHKFEIHRTSVCENCGESFVPTNSTNPSKYCSEQCFGESKQVELESNSCKNCGTMFQHYPSNEQEFCSRSCSQTGEYHPNWSGGSEDIRKSKEYRQWRQTIHKNYESCESCGATENLHAHHIVPVSEDEELATDVGNGVLLCGACHSEEHPNMPKNLFIGDVV